MTVTRKRERKPALTPYPTQVKAGHVVRDDDLSAKFADALAWSDLLIISKGGRVRAPHLLSDDDRERAHERLGELMAVRLAVTA